jgi:hypothetical protein
MLLRSKTTGQYVHVTSEDKAAGTFAGYTVFNVPAHHSIRWHAWARENFEEVIPTKTLRCLRLAAEDRGDFGDDDE